MAGKEYQMAFSIGAKLSGGFSSAFKGAGSTIQSLQGQISALQKTQGEITAYQRQQQAIAKTSEKIHQLTEEYNNLKNKMGESGNSSDALEQKMLNKAQKIDLENQKLREQSQRLDTMGASLQQAGVNTQNLASESQKLASDIDKLRDAQARNAEAADQSASSLQNAAEAMEALGAAVGAAKLLEAGVQALKECSEEAINFENSMAAVKRTVGGSDSYLSGLSESFKQLSTEIPITTTDLAAIATTAGQLGIAQSQVEEFTIVMAELGTATDLSADQAATMLAQFANITGEKDFQRIGSVVASLGDATATTASKVVEMSQGMAAAASQAGMSATDIMAIAAAVGSLGIEAASGSTSMSTLISTMYKATETGEKLEDFASVAGMSAEQFKKAWKEDAVGTLDAFIQGLNDTERNGKSAVVILDELGITNVRQTKAILGLASAGSLLSNTITQANTAWDENTALGEKTGVMYDTTQAKLTMMQNAFSNVKIAIGEAFTPTIAGAADALTGMLQPIATFLHDNPTVVKAITAVAGTIALVTAAVTGLAAAMKVFAAVSAAIPQVGAILAIAAAIGVVVGGIVALTDAINNSHKSMEDLDAEFDDLNIQFRQQTHIQDLAQEYRNLKSELDNAKGSAAALGTMDALEFEVEITPEAAATLGMEDFVPGYSENDPWITLIAGQADGEQIDPNVFVLDEEVPISAEADDSIPPEDFVADGTVQINGEPIKDITCIEFVEDSEVPVTGIPQKDINSEDFVIASVVPISAEPGDSINPNEFVTDDEVPVTGIPGNTINGADFAEDTEIPITGLPANTLDSESFVNLIDVPITGIEVKSLKAENFVEDGEAPITGTPDNQIDAQAFVKAGAAVISAKAAQDVAPDDFVTKKAAVIHGSAVRELLASGFLKGDDTIKIKGIPDGKITVDQYIAAQDRVVALTAEITNSADIKAVVEELKTSVSSVKEELTTAETQLASMEERKAQLEARLNHAKGSTKSDLQTEIEGLSDAIDAQKTKVDELQQKYTSCATEMALANAAASDLASKEQELAAVKQELASASNGVVDALENESAALDAQVARAERNAITEQAKLRSQIYDNATQQARHYGEAVQTEIQLTKENAGALDAYNRTMKYAGMSAEQVNAAYQGLLKSFDEAAQSPDFVPFSDEAKDAAAEIQALAELMGYTFDNLQQYADGSISFQDVFGYVTTNDTTLRNTTQEMSEYIGDYGEAVKDAQKTQNTFIENLKTGVQSGAITSEEAYSLLSSALTQVGADAETSAQAIAQLNAALAESPEAAEEATQAATDMNNAITPILNQMKALAEEYTNAYNSAYKNISGQFDLFETFSTKTDEATLSVGDMIKALESQQKYMQDYAANLQEAAKMGVSDGLIAELSDGSTQSAAYLNEIVTNGAGKIDELNAAFEGVQSGKDSFAKTVAEMSTEFSAKMSELETTLAATVETMNKSSEAAAAGAATVQAFADGASGQIDAVTAAFASVAQAAADALHVDISVPGHAAGTDDAERGWALVGEEGPELMWFNGGEQVLNNRETEELLKNNGQPAAALENTPVYGGSSIVVEINPVYNINGNADPEEMQSIFDDQNANLRALIEETLDEIESDRDRRRYS